MIVCPGFELGRSGDTFHEYVIFGGSVTGVVYTSWFLGRHRSCGWDAELVGGWRPPFQGFKLWPRNGGVVHRGDGGSLLCVKRAYVRASWIGRQRCE